MSDRRESNGDEQPQQQEASQRGTAAVKTYMMEHKVDTALWLTRALTLIFCMSYFLPFFSSPESSYQRVLMSNAATSALRLHQRIDRVEFARAFFIQLMAEDSAHYLLYSLNFMPCAPVTLVLMPIVLFALLHFASYTLMLFDVAGENNVLAPRFLISLVEFQQRNILRGAAFVEIFLMPLTVINLFFGRVSLLTPIVYYQFLVLRYQSRRNPHTRNMFHELRVVAEQFSSKSFVPSIVRTLILAMIQRISALGPQLQHQQ
ncbi:TMEM33/Pom33 family [Trinorchestia longiramus]|nr:TMEM33/Pom33 family [Trinorchestia longiramus]